MNEELKNEIKKSEKSIAEIARIIGISRQTLYQAINDRGVSAVNADKINDYFKCNSVRAKVGHGVRGVSLTMEVIEGMMTERLRKFWSLYKEDKAQTDQVLIEANNALKVMDDLSNELESIRSKLKEMEGRQ